MCLIIIKPPVTDLPKDDLLKQAFINNPHGAGIAYNDKGSVIIKKGYMNFPSFIEDYHKLQEGINLYTKTVIFHFRKASRGKVIPELTHPFPISDNADILKKHYCKTDYAVFHNGTIKILDKEVKKSKGLSDTFIFTLKYLFKLAQNEGWFYRMANKDLLELLVEGKMCILNGFGQVMCVGEFYSNNGLLFSQEIR